MVTASLKPPQKPPTGAEAADGAIAELNSLIEAKAAPEPPPPPPPPPEEEEEEGSEAASSFCVWFLQLRALQRPKLTSLPVYKDRGDARRRRRGPAPVRGVAGLGRPVLRRAPARGQVPPLLREGDHAQEARVRLEAKSFKTCFICIEII